jgi:hypothetical protein
MLEGGNAGQALFLELGLQRIHFEHPPRQRLFPGFPDHLHFTSTEGKRNRNVSARVVAVGAFGSGAAHEYGASNKRGKNDGSNRHHSQLSHVG